MTRSADLQPPTLDEHAGRAVPPSSDLAGALHDVSNALTVVVGWLEVALGKSTPNEMVEAIDVALSHARFGHRLARRAIGGSPAASEVACSALDEIIDTSLRAVEPFADRRGISVAIDRTRSNDDVYIDTPDAVTQILVNLLLNALAFTPQNGRVLVTTKSTRHSVVITVADDGPGIDPVRAETLLETPNSTRHGGTGIGLTHSAALARECGGHLRLVRHAPNAVFELRLQRASEGLDGLSEMPPPDECSRPYSSRPVNALELAGLNVLLLEDDDAICSLVELAFFARGSIVRSATTLARAQELSSSQQFDVALVDLSPIADDIVGGLAQIREYGQLPVVLITGSAVGLPPNAEQEFAAWVRKPFAPAELIDTVRRVTGRG